MRRPSGVTAICHHYVIMNILQTARCVVWRERVSADSQGDFVYRVVPFY